MQVESENALSVKIIASEIWSSEDCDGDWKLQLIQMLHFCAKRETPICFFEVTRCQLCSTPLALIVPCCQMWILLFAWLQAFTHFHTCIFFNPRSKIEQLFTQLCASAMQILCSIGADLFGFLLVQLFFVGSLPFCPPFLLKHIIWIVNVICDFAHTKVGFIGMSPFFHTAVIKHVHLAAFDGLQTLFCVFKTWCHHSVQEWVFVWGSCLLDVVPRAEVERPGQSQWFCLRQHKRQLYVGICGCARPGHE